MNGFLVVSRHAGDGVTITIPPSDKQQVVEVVVTNVERSKTRIGFKADRSVKIMRSELLAGPIEPIYGAVEAADGNS